MYYVLYTSDMHANHTNPQTQNGSARCHVFASLKYIYIFFKKPDRRLSEELMSVFFIQYLSMGFFIDGVSWFGIHFTHTKHGIQLTCAVAQEAYPC